MKVEFLKHVHDYWDTSGVDTGWLNCFTLQDMFSLCLLCQINDAKQQAQDTKDQAKDLQDRINKNIDSLSREKNKTNELIQQVKDYLTGQCAGDTTGTWSSP